MSNKIKIYYICFFLILFLSLFKTSLAQLNSTFGNVETYCNLSFSDAQKIEIKNIKKIKININNNKKWIKNSLNIIRLKKNLFLKSTKKL